MEFSGNNHKGGNNMNIFNRGSTQIIVKELTPEQPKESIPDRVMSTLLNYTPEMVAMCIILGILHFVQGIAGIIVSIIFLVVLYSLLRDYQSTSQKYEMLLTVTDKYKYVYLVTDEKGQNEQFMASNEDDFYNSSDAPKILRIENLTIIN